MASNVRERSGDGDGLNPQRARVVCNAPYLSSSQPLRKTLHWLLVEQRIQYKITVMTYKVRLHQQPQYLRELISDYLPARSLWSSNNTFLIVPSIKTVTAARAFRVAAPHIWNNLSITIRNATSLHQFCRLE